MRDKLALKTAIFIEKGVDDLKFLNEFKRKLDIARGRPVQEHTREDFISFFEYAFKAVYGETSKLAIIFLIAYMMNIIIPVVSITVMFATIRLVAGGTHMDSYLKCLMTTIMIFLFGSYSVLFLNTINFSKDALYLIIGTIYLIGVVLAYLYAPRDTPTKRITDPKSIKKRKSLTIVVLTLMSLIVTTIYINNQLVFLSCSIGILLEMLTLTPIALKISNIFYKYDKEGRDI